MPAYCSASRIANQIHRQILGPRGFTRRGRECERHAGGLRKTLTVLTRTVSARPQVQLVAVVAVAGLPIPVTGHRSDRLGGTADVEFLTARVDNEEFDEHRFDDLLTEIRQFYPHLRHRHPIIRPGSVCDRAT